jgi:purine-binding chemotaxis protein CheW
MEAMTQSASATGEEDLVASEYLTFTLGSEEYAIDILKVQEIRGYEQPTLIANSPPFIKGVINLRGTIVPIVDLRIKFNLGKIEYTPFTVVIILNVAGRVIGTVVDSVSDVISLTRAQIRAAPFRHPLHPWPGDGRRADDDRDRYRALDDQRRHGIDR